MVNLYIHKSKWYVLKSKTFCTATLVFAMCLATVHNSFGQELIVKGKVMDVATGEVLPGTNILLKGTNTGTTSDLNGEFSLAAPANGVLIVSFVGYRSAEVEIASRSYIDVGLELDAETLSEIVVVGYGSVEKKDITGTVAKVNTESFNRGLINAPDKLIDGKVAGLQINPSGEPGGGSAIRLRGVSINGEFPLIVVDGVPLDGGGGGVVGGRNPLSFVNPADVLDMTVLKDAQAAAIYGARGANGVIIITTKSGKSGKPKLSYSGAGSVSLYTRRPEYLTAEEMRAAVAAKAPQALNKLGNANTDWLDEVTGSPLSTQHNLSLSGGFDKTTYYTSAEYLVNNGVINDTQNKKINFSIKADQKLLNDNLIVGINSRTSWIEDQFGPNVIGAAIAFDPTHPILDPSNELRGGYFQWGAALATPNPVATQKFTNNRGKTLRNLTALTLQYKVPFLPGLSLNTKYSYDLAKGNYNGLTYAEAKESQNNGGSDLIQEQTKTILLNDYFATYTKSIGRHEIDVTAGYSWQNFDSEFNQRAGDSLKTVNGSLQSVYNIRTIDLPVENRLIGFFGRLKYEFSGKYIITTSVRRDGSSRFGLSNRWGVFPAASFGWRILEETFASSLTNIFSDLKFRASYGVTGNEQIGDYRYSTYYRYSIAGASYQFGDEYVPTLRPTGVDPDLKWEETVSTNIGLDAALLKGRLTASIDYYVKKVNDLLFEIAVPAGTNLSDRVLTNIGQVRNNGIELVLDGVAIDRGDLKWNIGFNASYNKNKIVKLDNLVGEALDDFPGYESGGISGDVGQTIQRRKVGYPVDAFFVYQHKKNADGSLKLDENGDGIQESIEMYVDQNGDGEINESDRVLYKKPNPDVLLGITSNIRYKKFDLSFTIKGSFGNYVYDNFASARGYTRLLNDPTQVVNNIHPSAFETGFKTRQLFSDYYVQNASYVKLDNITLGYNFDGMDIANLRAFITAQNPLIITPYKGVNPEVFNGIDNNNYPLATTITVGVSANFK